MPRLRVETPAFPKITGYVRVLPYRLCPELVTQDAGLLANPFALPAEALRDVPAGCGRAPASADPPSERRPAPAGQQRPPSRGRLGPTGHRRLRRRRCPNNPGLYKPVALIV
jgi:hypothetical protein